MRTVLQKRIMNYQTDSFNIVHHARYLELMEEGRWQYCYENGLVDEFHARGLYHVIVNINIDYRSSAAFGDRVTVDTEVSRITDRSVVFTQRVSRDDTVLVAADITNVFFYNNDNSIVRVEEMAPFWTDITTACHS